MLESQKSLDVDKRLAAACKQLSFCGSFAKTNLLSFLDEIRSMDRSQRTMKDDNIEYVILLKFQMK